MRAKEMIAEVMERLPEARLRQLLDFARFLDLDEERTEWQRFGQTQLARAYGPDEPEYTEADLKPETKP